MKTLYLDCGMGAAGDMLTAALIELLPDPDRFVEKLNSLGIPGVVYEIEKSVKCGVTGSHMSVKVNGEEEGEAGHEHHLHDHEHDYGHAGSGEHDHGDGHTGSDEHDHDHGDGHEHDHSHGDEHGAGHHHHNDMHGIRHIVTEHMALPQKVADDVINVYSLIADAESKVHGVPVSDIHFHEVGTMDAVADITAVCLLMDEISPDEVVVSPVHVGSGQVECAHGILPVPAPATALILEGIPVYGGEIQGELCTPTGAALLKYYASRFGSMPQMTIDRIGYGMGRKDFPAANCVRAMLGESSDRSEMVSELSCNVDDMTAEEIGYAMDRLFEGGANEVYTIPVGMKKNRPGTLIRVMCDTDDVDRMVRLIYRYTSTIGVRETLTRRYVLDRKIEKEETEFGEVRVKTSSGYGITRKKYEYDDVARIAKEKDLTVMEVRKMLDEEK